MATLIYWISLVGLLVYFIAGWSKSRNKLKSILGVVAAFVPFVNMITAIALVVNNWDTIKKKFG